MPGAATTLNIASKQVGGYESRAMRAQAAQAYCWLMPALVLVFVINIFVFASRPAEGGSHAVVVPPHLGQAALMETIAAAGGTLVRESRLPWLAIASPATGTAQAEFASALRQAGALLVLHPAVLAGCFSPDFHTADLADRRLRPSLSLSL